MSFINLADEIIEVFNNALIDTGNIDDAVNVVLDNYQISYYALMVLLGY